MTSELGFLKGVRETYLYVRRERGVLNAPGAVGVVTNVIFFVCKNGLMGHNIGPIYVLWYFLVESFVFGAISRINLFL